MKGLNLNSLAQKDVKLVEKRKWFFIIPAIFVVIGLIFMGIYWGVLGSPFNLGTDFTGGYAIQINAGTKIKENNYEEYKSDIKSLVEKYVYTAENGKKYTVSVSDSDITRIGSGTETAMRIQFRAGREIPKNRRDAIMEDLIPDLVDKINNVVAYETPTVTLSGGTATAKYDTSVKSYVDDGFIEGYLKSGGINASNIRQSDTDFNTVTFDVSGATVEDIVSAITIKNIYSAEATYTDMVGGTVSSELVVGAITAVLWALLLMLIYIVIRFEFASGVSTVIALLHDVAMMFVFMIIFRIEFNSTFIAAAITIVAYSINNSIIVFDRMRDNMGIMLGRNKKTTAAQVANKSVIETLSRSINTTLTTLLMIAMVALVCAIGGIFDMVTFSLPIILGLLAGIFSSTCIAPSIWTMMKSGNFGPQKSKLEFFKKIGSKKETAATLEERK